MIQAYGPIVWNSLPEELQNAPGICTFKDELKKYMFGQYDETLVNVRIPDTSEHSPDRYCVINASNNGLKIVLRKLNPDMYCVANSSPDGLKIVLRRV